MNIFSVETLETAWMDVVHPITGKKTNARIKVYSPESDAYRDGVNATMKLKKEEITTQLLEKSAFDIIIKCTAGWENIQDDSGELEFNEENVRKVYTANPWLKKQVDTFLNRELNFLAETPSN